MSLILDALKKSEAERLRGQTPTLLSPMAAAPSRARAGEKSRLPLQVLIVLLIIALILGYFYTKTPATSSPPALAPAVNEESRPVLAMIDPPVVAAPKPAAIKPAASPPVAVVTPSPIVPTATPEISPAPASIPEATPATRMASLSELPTEQRQQLPPLKLSMHVYSPEASKRFAIIDGQRVNEGSVLGTAVVEQIRQDGVVLSVQGQSYLLPRP